VPIVSLELRPLDGVGGRLRRLRWCGHADKPRPTSRRPASIAALTHRALTAPFSRRYRQNRTLARLDDVDAIAPAQQDRLIDRPVVVLLDSANVINKEATAAACASDIRENTMNIIRLSAMAALGFAALSGNASAQQRGTPTSLPPLQSQSLPPPTGTQTVQPFVPPPLPSLPSSAFTTCTTSCDTQVMNCQSACVPGGPVAPNPSCNLNCSSQQLACKQSCGTGQ
jgi:hypothetical protein